MPAVYSLVLALVVVGPLLGSGYLLLRDAVTTPRSYLTDSALGLGDAAPRAVPQDWLLAILSTVVDGGVVVKVILVGALWAAGGGAAALARRFLGVGLAPQMVAATVAVWNPYVAERLLQGHWSLLAGYAALPWTALAAQRIRTLLPRRTERAAQEPTPRPGAATSGADNPDHHAPRTRTGDDAPPETIVPEAETQPQPQSHQLETQHRRGRRHRIGPAAVDVSGPMLTAAMDSEHRRRWRGHRLSAWLTLGGTLAAAGLTPTGAILAGFVAVLLVGRRNVLGTVGLWCLASAPWLVATALSGAGAEPSDPAGIAAFAARAEPGLGTIGSLAGLGGIWNAQAVPGSRTTLFALVGTIVLLAIVATGVRRVAASGAARTHLDDSPEQSVAGPDADTATRYARRTLLVLAAAAIVLPALGATGWGVHFGEFLVARVPGAGLLRDTQKYVALAMPAFALCAAAGCHAIGTRGRRTSRAPAIDGTSAHHGGESHTRDDRAITPGVALTATLFIALLIAVLPDLAWGVGGALRPVHYPAGWARVAARLDGPGDVAVLPGGMFREFPYSGRVPVLDPAPRMLPRDVLQTGELPVRGGVVAGEGTRARAVERLLLSGAAPAPLAARGVGWILVEHNTPGPLGDSKTTLAQLNTVYSDDDLTLYRVATPADLRPASRAADRRIAIGAHLVWALLLAVPVAALTTRARPNSARTRPIPAPGR
nr:hypothetical protein [Nocardia albiluteola]